MRPETFIASRLFSSSKQKVSGTIIRIAELSVALGIAVMIISVAIIIGFKEQIKDKVIGFVADIQIESLDNNDSYEVAAFSISDALKQKLQTLPQIKHFQGIANKAGIIKTEDHIQGVVLKGVGGDYSWNYLQSNLIAGILPAISDTGRSNEVLISKNIADKLLLNAGDDLRMWFVSEENQQSRGRKFTISGIYETGLVEFDELYIFGDIKHVQKLNNWEYDQYGVVEIEINDPTAIDKVLDEVYFMVPANLTASSASQSFPHIFDWLDLQDMNVIILIILMVLVSGITMVSTLLIIILEYTSMIGVLKAMGARNGFIQRIFLFNSLAVLGKGLLWGNIFAIAFCLIQLQFGFLKLPAESYYLTEVPIQISIPIILIINAGGIFIWFFTLFIPTSVINKIQPIRAIRYN